MNTAAGPDPTAGRGGRDLRAVLLSEGIASARSGGPKAVSLRDVQRRAGVSNSAAYRHFADRAALLSSISDYAAEQMADRMRAAIDAAAPSGDDPGDRARARLRATGGAYLDYALTEPGLFAVAFQSAEDLDPARSADPADSPPFQLLVACLDDLVSTGVLTAADRAYTDITAWAAVHGLAVLLLDGPLRHLPDADRAAAIGRLLTVIDQGIGHRPSRSAR